MLPIYFDILNFVSETKILHPIVRRILRNLTFTICATQLTQSPDGPELN
jgi:hypothetical protein